MSNQLESKGGPLQGLKIVEIAGIGPGPHAATIFADMGADVIRIERPGGAFTGMARESDLMTRGRPSVALDLKRPEAVDVVLHLVEQADVLLEGMRPGVTERMGVGPDVCLERNPRLIYGRMTGWGQDGPLAHSAGHDINYISIAGALYGSGQDPERPHFAQNLIGDFGGGSTYLVMGVLAALWERNTSGRGQVIDAAIVDGTAHLNMMTSSMLAAGDLKQTRGTNLLDGGVPNYSLYVTSDGRHMAVGPLEGHFYSELLEVLGLDASLAATPEQARSKIAASFAAQPQAYWAELFAGRDACVAPVLRLDEAAEHPHMVARQSFVDREGITQPAPAPRFSRTESSLTSGPTVPGQNTVEALRAWGVEGVEELLDQGVAVQAG